MTETTFTIRWSPEDRQWIATHNRHEFLSWLEDDPADALAGLRAMVREIEKDMARERLAVLRRRVAERRERRLVR